MGLFKYINTPKNKTIYHSIPLNQKLDYKVPQGN